MPRYAGEHRPAVCVVSLNVRIWKKTSCLRSKYILDFTETLFIPDSGNPKGIMESADSKVEEVTWQTRRKCKHGLEQEMLELGIWGYGNLDCIVRLKM